MTSSYLKRVAYSPPKWASNLSTPPNDKIVLGNFPTPIFPFEPPGLPDGMKMWIKRDDFSGVEMSGNKARKLEFLMAEAMTENADCIVTCGGVQSNHCRATAVAARMLGMDSYLLLRTKDSDIDPGMVGNLMLDRLVGSKLILMSRQEYGRYGSQAMINRTCDRLREKNRHPYAIPVGGSNGLGTWGYLEMIRELRDQTSAMDIKITDVAFACGSGGSSAGMALGLYLQATNCEQNDPLLTYADRGPIPVHAYSVCDSPKYFYNYINDKILPEMGLAEESQIAAENILQITDSKGIGYAHSKPEELQYIRDVALKTGVILDPVYSGKALYNLIHELRDNQEKFSGKDILFVHTGGLFGLYDKMDTLQSMLDSNQVERYIP